MNLLIGKEFEKATIFEPGFAMGYRQSEVKQLGFQMAADGWGKLHFAAEFVFRGKRKKQSKAVKGWVIRFPTGTPDLSGRGLQVEKEIHFNRR